MEMDFDGYLDLIKYIKNTGIENISEGNSIPTAYFAYDLLSSNLYVKVLDNITSVEKIELEMYEIIKKHKLEYCIVVMEGKISYKKVIRDNVFGIQQNSNINSDLRDSSMIITYVNKNSVSTEIFPYNKNKKTGNIEFKSPMKFLDLTMDSVASKLCETLFEQEVH